MNDAMAFGDGLNDMEMLHAVGFGVAMGNAHPEFEKNILETVRQHAPDTEPHHITTRQSSKGNYTGATVKVNVESKEQLDKIYRALTDHEMVKVVY